MTPGSIFGRSLYLLTKGPSSSCIPSFEAVTKHSVSGVPGPSVGTLRVAVGNGVRTTGVVEKSKVGNGVNGPAAEVASENVGRDANVESIVASGTGVLVRTEVAEKISGPGAVCVRSPTGATGAQAGRISIVMIIEEKMIVFILHSRVHSSGLALKSNFSLHPPLSNQFLWDNSLLSKKPHHPHR